MPIERIELPDKEVIVVGTAHVSQSSVDEVRAAIREHHPDEVAIELCQSRFDVLMNPGGWQDMDIIRVIKEKRTSFLLANLVMASFQRRIGERFGVKPGDEMRAAIEEAQSAGVPIALVDRPVQLTLQRAWKSLRIWGKIKLLFSSLYSILAVDEIKEEEIERLKDKDALTSTIEEVARQAPTVKLVLIDERDAYMARRIVDLKGRKVLAVVGAGHMNGLIGQMKNPVRDIGALEYVPQGKKGIARWIIPLAILVLIIAGFFFGSPEQGYEMVKWWFLCNAVFAALGTAIALGHPVTVLVATLASPITSLNPTLAAGWFAGLSEAYIKRPKVSDFEAIQDDIVHFTGWWKNPVVRILLVVILANLGSSIGAIVAMPILAKIALSG
ncbi:MAG TPA: TraB/GumN family protein [Deltaproteobacteria bacterium]|nr:TraB/GumN family protein [Deltaproteobacteria bacterium]